MDKTIYIREFVKLSLFMFFLLFLSGRAGLLLHEFAGHALSWRLFDGNITDFRLFLFGGGWVQYARTTETLTLSHLAMIIVQLSGIAAELAAGSIFAFLALFLKTTRLAKALFYALSSVLLVHGLFYLVICTYYGSGDGRIIFNLFNGNVRHGFLVLTSCLTVGGAFFVSFKFSPAVKGWVVDFLSKNRSFLLIISVVAAAMLHSGLNFAERIFVNDRVYAGMKTSVNDRLKQEKLAEFIETYAEKYGREANQEEISAFAETLENKYGQFPIGPPLAFAVCVAFLGGFLLSGDENNDAPNPIKWKDNLILGSISLLTVVLIMALNTCDFE